MSSPHRDDGYYSANPSFISLSQTLGEEDGSGKAQQQQQEQEERDKNFLAELLMFQQKQQQFAESPVSPVGGGASFEFPQAITMTTGTETVATGAVGETVHQTVGLEQSLAALQQPQEVVDHDDAETVMTDSEADSAYDDASSLLGDDTKSLSTYITDYRVEHGRRYHAFKDGAYWGPNDEPASEIQDLAHHIYLITLDNKLHLAPLKEIHNVLDVGTGTGIWAMDFADTWPSAAVLGVDLSPTQPSWVPINCAFEIDDLTAEWTWPDGHFDYIHVREMFGSIPDWDTFFEQCYRCTSSGGWVEVVEHSVEPTADDDTMPPDHFYWKWGNTVVTLGNKIGKSFTIYKEAKERLERAGFVDVVEVQYKWPMNAWPDDVKGREIGRWNQLRLYDGVEGFMLRLLTGPGEMSYEAAQLFLAEMRTTLKDYSAHAYLPGTVVYARKP